MIIIFVKLQMYTIQIQNYKKMTIIKKNIIKN